MAFAVPLYEYTLNFSYALILGMLFGLIYDLFRISRIIITGRTKHTKLILYFDSLGRRIPTKKTAGMYLGLKKLTQKFYSVFVFFEDVLFFVISALIMTVFLYQVNYGQLRLYVYIGVFMGFFAYYHTIGRLCTMISAIIVSIIKLLFAALNGYVFIPLWSFTVNTVSVPVNFFRARLVLKASNRKIKKLFAMSKNGFGYKASGSLNNTDKSA